MELSKKWLLGAMVLGLVFGFAGCKLEEDEDGSISGSDIVVDNSTGTTTKRAYSSTSLKHLGTLARIELREQTATSADGVVGVIWDLKKSADASDKTKISADNAGDLVSGSETLTDAINFFIIGFTNYNGTLGYYISKFYNVTSVNEANFGARDASGNDVIVADDATGLASSSASEQVIVNGTVGPAGGVAKSLGTAAIEKEKTTDASGTIYVWADIYPANTKYGLQKAKYATAADTGKFIVDIYLGADTPTASSTPAETIEITSDQTGYSSEIKQAKAARYGSAYQGKIMKGYVKYQDTYAASEVIEDAE